MYTKSKSIRNVCSLNKIIMEINHRKGLLFIGEFNSGQLNVDYCLDKQKKY